MQLPICDSVGSERANEGNRPYWAVLLLRGDGMTREQIREIVAKSKSTTLFAYRMREAFALPHPVEIQTRKRARVRDRGAKGRKNRGARKLMAQRHGVRL